MAPEAQAEKRWPDLKVGRLKVGDQTPEIHHGAVEHGPAWEHETYVPVERLTSEGFQHAMAEEIVRLRAYMADPEADPPEGDPLFMEIDYGIRAALDSIQTEVEK